MADHYKGTLYIGVTSDIHRRVGEHRSKGFEGFTKKYQLTRLVYYKFHVNIADAIEDEKRQKNWKRAWKINLISEVNPSWRDLSNELGYHRDADLRQHD